MNIHYAEHLIRILSEDQQAVPDATHRRLTKIASDFLVKAIAVSGETDGNSYGDELVDNITRICENGSTINKSGIDSLQPGVDTLCEMDITLERLTTSSKVHPETRRAISLVNHVLQPVREIIAFPEDMNPAELTGIVHAIQA